MADHQVTMTNALRTITDVQSDNVQRTVVTGSQLAILSNGQSLTRAKESRERTYYARMASGATGTLAITGSGYVSMSVALGHSTGPVLFTLPKPDRVAMLADGGVVTMTATTAGTIEIGIAEQVVSRPIAA